MSTRQKNDFRMSRLQECDSRLSEESIILFPLLFLTFADLRIHVVIKCHCGVGANCVRGQAG